MRQDSTADLMTVRTYAHLKEYVGAFADGHLNLLILIGNPGLGKSRLITEALQRFASCWIEGNATAFGIYQTLFQNRDCDFVVIDDVDSLYSDRIGVRILKGLCQTEPQKTVAWHASARGLKREGVPATFTTSARVLIISNDWRTLNKNVLALQDRGFVVVFDPSAEEVHREVGRWYRDEEPEIYDWFGRNLARIPQPSMRNYARAAMLKRGGLDWTQALPAQKLKPRARLVADLLADPSFTTTAERVRAFESRGGGSRRTFFNYRKKLIAERAESVSR